MLQYYCYKPRRWAFVLNVFKFVWRHHIQIDHAWIYMDTCFTHASMSISARNIAICQFQGSVQNKHGCHDNNQIIHVEPGSGPSQHHVLKIAFSLMHDDTQIVSLYVECKFLLFLDGTSLEKLSRLVRYLWYSYSCIFLSAIHEIFSDIYLRGVYRRVYEVASIMHSCILRHRMLLSCRIPILTPHLAACKYGFLPSCNTF